MFSEAKDTPVWDLAVPKSMRTRFLPKSFYIVIEGFALEPVRVTARRIKEAILEHEEVRVRGPLALPTVRRRHLVMREMQSDGQKGQHLANAKRFRHVLLVIKPTSAAVSGLIALSLPTTVNVKIEPYRDQFDLKDDRQ